MFRLFFGIALDKTVCRECAAIQDQLRSAAFEARYEPDSKFHLTLAFLGNVPPERFEPLQHVAEAVAARTAPFALELNKLGAFPNERRPRVVYVGARDQGASFRTLAYALRDECRTLGFTFNEDAVAHVTIARVKGGGQRPLPMLDVRPMVVHVNSIALFESIPDGRTTRYEIRAGSPLTAGAHH